LNRGVAVSFTVKLEVPAQVYILAIFTTSQHVGLPSIFNSFPVIRTASAKKSPFSRIAAHIFVSPGDAPATITQYVAWMKDNSMLAKPLASCTYLSSIVSELYDA